MISKTWKTSGKVFSEIWNNKVLSLFYLMVGGANVFEFSGDVLEIHSLWQRIFLASVVPVLVFSVLIVAVIGILECFKHTKIVMTLKEATREFFQIFEDDDSEEAISSVKITLKQRAWYILMDYWAVFACIGVVALMNYFERSFVETAIVTAIYDFIVAFGFMMYSLKTGKDVTFGEGYRRAIDVIHRESKIIGYLGMVVLNAKATIWDGPEQVPMFFQRELCGLVNMTALLVVLAAIQGMFWAWLYSYGYESVFQAVKSAM